MKSFKISLAVIALFGAVTLSAFTKREKVAVDGKFADAWYSFIGNPTLSGDRANPAKYVKISPQPADIKAVCPDADVLCAVKLTDNGTSNPTQAELTAIQAEITTAQNTNVETSRVELFD